MEENNAEDGDSGGPWHWIGRAYGVHEGEGFSAYGVHEGEGFSAYGVHEGEGFSAYGVHEGEGFSAYGVHEGEGFSFGWRDKWSAVAFLEDSISVTVLKVLSDVRLVGSGKSPASRIASRSQRQPFRV